MSVTVLSVFMPSVTFYILISNKPLCPFINYTRRCGTHVCTVTLLRHHPSIWHPTLSTITFVIMTLSITTLILIVLLVKISRNKTEHQSITTCSIAIMRAIMMNDVTLNVVAPL
jgi:hypothetical protein